MSDTPDLQQPLRVPRPNTYRDWIRAGFFMALGVALLALLALAVNRLWGAALAIAAPFVVAVALALMLDPLVDRMERANMRRGFAVGIVFLVLVGTIIGLLYLAVPALISQAENLTKNGPEYIQRLRGTTNDFLKKHPRMMGVKLPRNFDALFQPISDRAAQYVNVSAGKVTGFLLGSIETILQAVITLIATFYLLLDIDRIRARVFYLAPERWRGPMSVFGRDIGGVFSSYLRGLLIVSLMYGAATFVMLLGMGLVHREMFNYALIVGFAGGLLYTVPYIGPLLTGVITFIVCFAAGGFGFGVAGIGATLVLNTIFDNIIMPRIVGGGVGLNAVISLFALTLGGTLFGLWGLLLSVPVAASVQAILFRLFPKLTTPTPPPFLRAQGVAPDEAESPKILRGDKPETPEQLRAE